MAWSRQYHEFASVLDRLERQSAADDIRPHRDGDEFRIILDYTNGEDAWADELRSKAAEIERLQRHFSPSDVNVRLPRDTVEIILVFDFSSSEDGGEGDA